MRQPLHFCGNVILEDTILPGACVTVSGGRIISVSQTRPNASSHHIVDSGNGYISPGFVDIHVHGGDGADYMDGDTSAVVTANRAHLRHGTTTIFPTTTTGSPNQLDRMIRACIAVQKNWTSEDGARIAGIHFYGPYFSEDKVGCHSPEGRRNPDPAEYLPFLSLGIIRIATCAAELPGCEAFYRAAREYGCLITCGHSNASWTEMQKAFDAGVRHVDHFWCAMSSVASLRSRLGFPMQGSMEQFVLANNEMTTEVIADAQHLSAELLEFAYRMKGPNNLCLVTDSSRALDMPAGRYRFGCKDDGSWIENNGLVGLAPEGGTNLGSLARGYPHGESHSSHTHARSRRVWQYRAGQAGRYADSDTRPSDIPGICRRFRGLARTGVTIWQTRQTNRPSSASNRHYARCLRDVD
jgi:N-acetylglucosamine-6-phosphate deacetylase